MWNAKWTINSKEAQHLWAIAGQLNWISWQTRPDISYQVCEISTSVNDTTINDLKMADKYMCKLKNSKVILRYPSLGIIERWKLLCFSDGLFEKP